MIEKALMALLVLFIVPELLGMLVTRFFKNEKNNLILSFIIGYIIEFAICQLIIVPFIYEEKTLTYLIDVLIKIFGVLSILSIIINIFRIKEIFIVIIDYIKKMPKLLSFVTIILISIQIYAFVGYMHIDDDDSFYIGTATTAIETDSLFKYSAATGEENLENKLPRYRLRTISNL